MQKYITIAIFYRNIFINFSKISVKSGQISKLSVRGGIWPKYTFHVSRIHISSDKDAAAQMLTKIIRINKPSYHKSTIHYCQDFSLVLNILSNAFPLHNDSFLRQLPLITSVKTYRTQKIT